MMMHQLNELKRPMVLDDIGEAKDFWKLWTTCQGVLLRLDQCAKRSPPGECPRRRPIPCILYINNIVLNIDSTIKLFADDAKIFRVIHKSGDSAILQQDLIRLEDWSRKWLLVFNNSKCKVVHFGHNNPQEPYKLNGSQLEQSEEEKDLGVNVTNKFKFSSHISKAASKANGILGRIRRTFSYFDIETTRLLYTSLVCPT